MGYEYKVEIGGVTYDMNHIQSVNIETPLFDKLSVGNACSAELEISFWPTETVPRMATIIPYCRETSTDEWYQLGVFYTDTRSLSNGLMTVVAYDAMLKAEKVWEPDQTLVFPMTMTAAVSEIISLMGVELDSRTVLKTGDDYVIDYPANDYTFRDVLRFIAAANAGNWIITPVGKLRLVPLFGSTVNHDVSQKVSSFEAYDAVGPITGVSLLVDSETEYFSGSRTGYVLEADCPYATQTIADAVLASITGQTYYGFRAENAVLTHSAELGDGITVNGTASFLAYRRVVFGPGHMSEIAAPGENVVDHEYPYVSQTQKIERKLAQTNSRITKTAEEILLEVSGKISEDEASSLISTAISGITLAVSSKDGSTTFTLTGGGAELSTQTLNLSVNAVNISGTLTASQIDATDLKVAAANITGSLTIGQLPDSVAETSDIPTYTSQLINNSGYQTESGVTTIIGGTVTADYINALDIYAAKLIGQYVGLYANKSIKIGSMEIVYTSTGVGLGLYTNYGGIKIESAGNVFLNASSSAFFTLGTTANGAPMCQLGGTDSTNKAVMVIPGGSYGTTLPSGVQGQIFFQQVS